MTSERTGGAMDGVTSGLAGGPRPSVREALARAASVDTLAPDAETRARDAVALLEKNHAPWYLRLIVGVGAWVAALFLMPFIGGIIYMVVGDQPAAGILFGLLLTAAATAWRRRASGLFARQVLLVFGFAGQALFLLGVGGTLESSGATCLAAILISAALLFLHPDRIQRFCSTGIIIAALVFLISDYRVGGALDGLVLSLVFALLALWRLAPRAATDEAADLVEPVVYAIVLALFGLLIADAVFGFALADPEFNWLRLSISAKIGFIVALLWLASAIFAERGMPLTRIEPIAAFVGIALIGAVTRHTPAIVVAMMVGLLGFDRRAPMIVALAAAFFLGFGGFYYYSLMLTLLQKSILLAVSGGICLAGWVFVLRGNLLFTAGRSQLPSSSGEVR